MDDEHLLAAVEDLLRTSPPQSAFKERENDEALSWLGRTEAVLRKWNSIQSIAVRRHISALQDAPNEYLASFPTETRNQMILAHNILDRSGPAYRGIRTLLFQAQHDLRMKTVGPLSVAISGGRPFDYFDEIREIIEMARNDRLFVDPYLDSKFVSLYLPQITSGVTVRLLTLKKLLSLLPAVETLVVQSGLRVEVRSATSGLHDRYVFVDEARCYQSGASFKDGAKQSQTTLTQITDAFEAVFQTYQRMWDEARVEQGLGSGPI